MNYERYFNFKKITLTILVVTAILFSSYPVNAKERNKDCLEYRPTVVMLGGVIEKKVFQGVVDWGPKSFRDKLHKYWVLSLKDPICVNASPLDEMDTEEHNVRILQVVSYYIPDFYEKIKNYLLKKVVITGELHHRVTGHQREDVLIDVMQIEIVEGER